MVKSTSRQPHETSTTNANNKPYPLSLLTSFGDCLTGISKKRRKQKNQLLEKVKSALILLTNEIDYLTPHFSPDPLVVSDDHDNDTNNNNDNNNPTTISTAPTTNNINDNHMLINYHQPYLLLTSDSNSLPTIHQKTTRDLEDELLKQEEYLLRERSEMVKRGQWSIVPMKKSEEPARNKTNWDYLLKEMEWLAKDFADERRHKMKVAKQCANGAVKHHKATVSKEQKKKKDEEQQIRKLASNIAKLVKKDFWSKLEKIVSIRNQTKIDIKRQQYLQKKQNMLVEKSERLSQFLSQDLVTPSTPLTPMFNQQQPQEQHEFSDYNNVTEEQKSNLDQMMIDGDETSIVIPKASDVEHYEPSVDSHSHMLLMRDEDDNVEGSTMNDVDEDDEEFILETNHALKSSTQEKSDAGVEEAVNEEDFDHEEQEDDDDRISSSDEEAEEEMADYSDEIAELQKDQHVPLTEIIQNYSHDDESEERRRIQMASQSAQQFQPTGFTLSTSTVRTKVPDLLNPEFTLREYQHIGLDWLVAMHDRGLNGILADEMGLGKTFMTIATLAYLASEKHIWGPHLVVAPASVLLNWEIEFKRFCPSFKILAYYGSQKQRKEKRIGWNKPDTFHVCITSYNLVVQDKNIFKRKKWHYLILDEAHHIKNFKSQCWQTLLNFNTSHRILLTGTPLQNNVMELWSLMHFLMPQVFQSHSEFKEWFANPVSSMVEGNQEMNEQNRRIIARLHSILRPFILRRLKADVAKQLPKKHEHVVQCNLSKRQRFLYEDFMARSDTRTNLISGNFFKIINVMMQLRKVCNHPDLFETRPIISPFESSRLKLRVPSLVTNMHYSHPLTSDSRGYYANRGSARVDTSLLGLELSTCLPSTFEVESLRVLQEPLSSFESRISDLGNILTTVDQSKKPAIFLQYQKRLEEIRTNERKHKYSHLKYLNDFRCQPHSIYYRNTLEAAHVTTKDQSLFFNPNIRNSDTYCSLLHAAVKTPEQRIEELDFEIENFVCIIPKTRAEPVELLNYCENPIVKTEREYKYFAAAEAIRPKFDIFNRIQARTQVYFPDKRLLQYDCGKLQVLARLLRKLQSGNHRVLIFTQMSSMLNILEAFLSMHSYSYFRLDGSTKIEQRQYLMDRFNNDPKIFAFILSTRSGGLGINLTGADTVVFYDSDWNPAMDAQAQDRCHRIGQTREVNIYRLISESTIEERILLKANQKRQMNDMVIHEGGFTPDLLKKMDVTDFFDSETLGIEPARQSEVNEEVGNELTQKDVERALASAEDEDDVIAYRNARKEENEMFKLDFEEEFDQDLEQNLRNIEKFGVRYLEMRSQGVLEQEMANLEEQHRLSEESWKNDMDDIEQRVEEESNRRAFAQEEFDENIIEVFPDVEQEDFLKAFQVFLPELECHDLYKELLKPTPEEERLIREAEDLYTFGPYKVSPLPEVELVPEVVVASNDALAETIQDSSTSRTTPATSAPVVAPKQKSTEKDLTKTNKKKKRRRSESGVDESATTEPSATVTPATKKMKLEDKKKDKKKKGTTDELEQGKKEEKSGEKKTKKDKKTKKEKSKEETPSKVSTKKDKEKEKETKKSSKKKLEESTKEKKSEKKTAADKSEKASSEKTDKSDKKIDKKERKKDKKKTAGETETKSSSKTAAIAAKNETTESSTSAIKDTPWKTFEDQALLQSVHLVKQESLEELNWNVIKDTYATLVYPIVSARAIEQMQQRYAIVSKKEASSSSSTQKSLTQSIFDARKQNFTKYWNLWVKSKTSSSGATKKKSTTEKISKKKKKAQKNPLMPSGVSEYFSPMHYTQLYAEILSSAQNAQKVNATRLPKTPANAATTFTTNGMSGPTLASSLKTPANNTPPGPSAPNTGARKTTIIKKNSITPMPPTNNPSSSQAVPLQINNNQPPMMTNPLPAHNHPQTFTTYSNLIPGTFPMQQPLTANQFGRVNNSGLQMGFMSSNPLFPGGINMGNMPMTRPIPSNNIPNQPQFPAGVFSNLVAAQPTPVQQSSQAISSDKMARFLLQKFPNSRAEVSTVMAQAINDNQKSQLLMQIHQRYATPTLPQHVQPAPPTVSAPPTGGVFTGLLAQGPSPQPTSTTPTSNTQPPPQQ